MAEHENFQPISDPSDDPLVEAEVSIRRAMLAIKQYGSSPELTTATTKLVEAIHWIREAQED